MTITSSPEKNVEAVLLKTRTFRRKPGDIPYPVKHFSGMSNFDIWDNMFFSTCCRGLTMHQFDKPPTNVLDLGCGSGFWAIQAAKQWTSSSIVGYDCRNLQPNLFAFKQHGDIAQRVRWVHGNLLEGLPFPSFHFDFVRVVGIGLGVPEDEWQYVLEDIARVMKSGAIIEVIEEDPIFPCASHLSRPFLAPFRTPPPRLDLPWALQESLVSPYSDSSSTLFSDPHSATSEDRIDVLSYKSTDYLKPVTPTSTSPNSQLGPLISYSEQKPEPDSVVDPRDHTRLKAAWEVMLSSRFLATKLLAVLPFYLSSVFIDIQINPPLRVHLPPNSNTLLEQRQSVDSVSSDPVASDSSHGSCSISPGRRSSCSMQSISSPSFTSSCTTMHLARTVETIKGCKEAIWEEYEKLYSTDSMPAVTRTARPQSAAVLSAKPSARETFEAEWSVWENDMTDRIAMRGSMLASLAWPEPPGERPDWRVWRSTLDNALSSGRRDSGSSTSSVSKEQSDLCRSISTFVGYKI